MASDGSVASSRSRSSLSSQSSGELGSRDAVTSLVALGEGHFLTASKYDRVIKAWRAGAATIDFVRDYAGHHTGITALARVDEKGRFLSASKDRVVKLWDSRLNCDDDEDSQERRLLATFANMDLRSVSMMAVLDEGSYVRPTDQVCMAMVTAMTIKAVMKGSSACQQAAKERHIIGCTCQFATISGRHNLVKVWSVKEVERQGPPQLEEDKAEVTLQQELEHEAIVESVTSARMTGMLLTGDRMGTVKLWHSENRLLQFSPSNGKLVCVRTFSWRSKAELSTIQQSMQLAITSLSFLQGNALFVCGSKGGDLRVWKVDGTTKVGETVRKEAVLITGAHAAGIVAVRPGPRATDGDDALSFSSAARDGKVLSFSLPVAEVGRRAPRCVGVVNHNIAERYSADPEHVSLGALACVRVAGRDALLDGTDDGGLHLHAPHALPPGRDALRRYRRRMEEEALTLRAIAAGACGEGGVDTRDRKQTARTYRDVFAGSDLVSHLVDRAHAASREDALALACVLASRLSLFECATKRGKALEDSAKSFHRWSGEFSRDSAPTDPGSAAPTVE